MLLRDNDYLTNGDPAQIGIIAQTHKGQAHFAEPSLGKCCGGCAHHVQMNREKGRRCEKFRSLTRGWGRRFRQGRRPASISSAHDPSCKPRDLGALRMSSFSSYCERISRLERDASDFAAMGGNALIDADRILVELIHLPFEDIYDTVSRFRLQNMRDEAVVSVSRAIEEAE